MEEYLKRQLEKTLYVHYPLEAEEEKGAEAELLARETEKELVLWDGASEEKWSAKGRGRIIFSEGTLQIQTNSVEDHWPETENQNGIYSTFGDYTVYLDLGGMDLSEYNQIYFEMKADCDGLHSPMVRVGFENDGKVKIPDSYSREGFNAVALDNGRWCKRIWTITEIAHDRVTKIFFRFHKYGKELTASDEMRFELKNIRMQKVVRPQVTKGWQCEEEKAVFSTSGYWTHGEKTAVANTKERRFCVVCADTGKVCLEKEIGRVQNFLGDFGVMDFSEIEKEGTYRLKFGGQITQPFRIGEKILESAMWRVINFLFCERCGFPIPGKHGTCHQDVFVEHNGVRMIYAGGWHDAADVSQQTVQTAEIVHALMECAQAVEGDGALSLRLLEEAGWGMDFVLRTRFGDGYRASSAGHRRWTDNLLGNFDDVPGRLHRNAFDNYIMAGVEAAGAGAFADTNPELAWKCREAAKEDFAFAQQVFGSEGILRPSFGEHTYNACESQHYAAAAWAAACIYKETGQDEMEEACAGFMKKLLACQERDGVAGGIRGFFYRDESCRTIVHFSHQAREHLFAQAMTKALEVFWQHPDAAQWRDGMLAYASYLKELMGYAAPYGMIPSGIYCDTELEDQETFDLVHPHLDFAAQRAHYKKQLENGIPLGEGYCIKNFPVWFSYRGNNAVLLSMGKSASLLGKALQDARLTEIARGQMYWIAGKNPFGNSFIYGEGSGFGKQYNALMGEMVGEMPVGTQTQEDEDIPYWPMANIACYREVWTTVAGRWLWVAADLYQE